MSKKKDYDALENVWDFDQPIEGIWDPFHSGTSDFDPDYAESHQRHLYHYENDLVIATFVMSADQVARILRPLRFARFYAPTYAQEKGKRMRANPEKMSSVKLYKTLRQMEEYLNPRNAKHEIFGGVAWVNMMTGQTHIHAEANPIALMEEVGKYTFGLDEAEDFADWCQDRWRKETR
jgi:hypothetical protein